MCILCTTARRRGEKENEKYTVDNCCECDTGSCVPPAGPSSPLYPILGSCAFPTVAVGRRGNAPFTHCHATTLYKDFNNTMTSSPTHPRLPPSHMGAFIRGPANLSSENQIWMGLKKLFSRRHNIMIM